MDSLDRYKDIAEYLGDPSEADWVGQGEPVVYNGNVLLTMPPKSVGTVLATSTYLWYGNVKAKLKTSRGKGVVTAFILLSDVKDEIDYEFVGVDLSTAQTNYYFQGIPNYDQSKNITELSNTYDEFHEYEIQWTPDEIKWLVDGKLGRTKKRADTWNETAQQWDYPQTPARVQISIWPGGLESNAKGTIDWAGGVIDWNSQEIKDYGYYFATFGEITVECYNAKSAPGTNKGKSYYYNDISATNNTVVDSDKSTILKSFLATGTDPDKGETKGTKSGSATASSASSVNAIPGGGSAPGGQIPGAGNADTGAGSDSGSSSEGSSGGSPAGTASGCAATGFAQKCNDGNAAGSNSNSGAAGAVERTLGASAFAGIVGFAALLLV
jgi:beta-glucanase (GH16 family)